MSTLSVNSIKDVQSFDFANTSFAGAYGTANSGYVVANASFGVANTALQNTSGTFAGNLTTTGNLVSARVGSGFTPTSGRYFVAGADMARGISVANDRTTHLRFDNNGLNYIFVENFGISGTGQGTGFQFFANSVSSGDTGYTAGSLYALANGLYTSAATANSHLVFGTALQNNLNERMRITDGGNVGIGTTSPTARLQFDNGLTDNKINLYRVTGDVYGMGLQNSQLLIYSGAGGSADGGVYLGKHDGTTFTESMRVRNNGSVTKPNQPFARIHCNATNITLSGGTQSVVPFNSVDEQTGSNYNTSTYRFTAPVTGKYVVTAMVEGSGLTTSTWYNLFIRQNGSNKLGTFTNGTGLSYQPLIVYGVLGCNAGDYLDVAITPNATAGILELNTNDTRNMFCVYLLG